MIIIIGFFASLNFLAKTDMVLDVPDLFKVRSSTGGQPGISSRQAVAVTRGSSGSHTIAIADIGGTSDSILLERGVIDSVELPSVSTMKERGKTVSFDDSPPSCKRLKVGASGPTTHDLVDFKASAGVSSPSTSDLEAGSLIKCSTLSVTTIATTSHVIIPFSQEKATDDSPVHDQSLVVHGTGIMSSGDVRCSDDISPDGSDDVYIPQWDVTNDSFLSGHVECRSLIDKVAPSRLSVFVNGLSYGQFFFVYDFSTAHQTVLGSEVRRRGEELLQENVNFPNLCNELKARLSLADAEVAKVAKLRKRVSVLESS